MKRGFLFGLGSFLVCTVLDQLRSALGDECGLTINGVCYVSTAVMIALSAPLSGLAIWKANATAPNKSWLHAIGGWLIGFFFIPVVTILLLIAVGIATGTRSIKLSAL